MTLLAVAEHLDPTALERLLAEAHRVLAPGGRLMLTTPAARADRLLHFLARVRLVSPEEIEEHKYAYTPGLLGWYFGRAGFADGAHRDRPLRARPQPVGDGGP